MLIWSPSLLHPSSPCCLLATPPTPVPAGSGQPGPGTMPSSCWACLLLGLEELRVSSTGGGKGRWGPQHLVSTWLPSPSEVQEHWGRYHL